jgi:hypothetical protein
MVFWGSGNNWVIRSSGLIENQLAQSANLLAGAVCCNEFEQERTRCRVDPGRARASQPAGGRSQSLRAFGFGPRRWPRHF